MNTRAKDFQSHLQSGEMVLLSTSNDIHYFSDFEFLVPEEREAFLVFTEQDIYLIVSGFSPEPNGWSFEVLRGCQPASLAEHIFKIVTTDRVSHIHFQGHSLFVDELESLKKKIGSRAEFSPLHSRAIWQSRMIKDAEEIASLRQASQIVAQAANEIEKSFEVGITELELTEKLNALFLKCGADGLGFPTIVAFGDHGTSPHHQPGNMALSENMAILIDCGAMVDGYRSDLTRTWWFGKKKAPAFSEIEEIVLAAYQKAIESLEPGITAKKVDEITRQLITKAGYGPQFIHTTGHGVGLDIHEPPSLSWNDETLLQPGMVITIEPGIYLDGKFGYRFENTLLITETGAEVLTQA